MNVKNVEKFADELARLCKVHIESGDIEKARWCNNGAWALSNLIIRETNA